MSELQNYSEHLRILDAKPRPKPISGRKLVAIVVVFEIADELRKIADELRKIAVELRTSFLRIPALKCHESEKRTDYVQGCSKVNELRSNLVQNAASRACMQSLMLPNLRRKPGGASFFQATVSETAMPQLQTGFQVLVELDHRSLPVFRNPAQVHYAACTEPERQEADSGSVAGMEISEVTQS